MTNIKPQQSAGYTKVVGGDEAHAADVLEDPVDGVKRLQSSAKDDPQGLKGSWRITTILVTDALTLLPAVALPDRNFIRIENTEPSKEVYIGPDNTLTADRVAGTTSGKKLDPGESVTLDFKDTLPIYGRCEPTKTAWVQIIEAV